MNKIAFTLVLLSLISAGCSRDDSGLVDISNGRIIVSFERQTGKLVSFFDAERQYEFIDSLSSHAIPWRIDGPDTDKSYLEQPFAVSFKKFGRSKLGITWRGVGKDPLVVSMDVSLDKNSTMSRWKASFKGIKDIGGTSVVYPVFSGVKTYQNAELVIPTWLGTLVHDPGLVSSEEKPTVFYRSFPGSSAQLMALYDRDTMRSGLYLSSQDTLSTLKTLSFSFTPGHVDCHVATTIPDRGETDSYSPGYDVVVGSFDGDWTDAADIYKKWAVTTSFCRESRFRKAKTPEWLANTALWVWNRGKSDNVLKEAEDIQERIGLPVNTYWHWWHASPYDLDFPEYFPPREGAESFVKAVEHAHQKDIHSLVYVNARHWGDSTDSWKHEGVEAYASKKNDGSTYRDRMEAFSEKGMTAMCMATRFWQDKYTALCDTVVNKYHVDGVYMDEACAGFVYPCHDTSHGHLAGDGSSDTEGVRDMVNKIRDQVIDDSKVMLAGEGSGEDYIPLLDAFLTLYVSKERFQGVSRSDPIPLFQAIYHEYAITYGNYSSLVYPPYDELWPKEYKPANAETLMPEQYNMQFRMEQARSFVWGMQPTIANYHSTLFKDRKQEMEFLVDLVKTRYNAKEYLLDGQFKGIPQLSSPEVKIPMLGKQRFYDLKTGKTMNEYEKVIKLLYSSLWLSKEGNLGVAVTNISDESLEFELAIDPEKYGISKEGTVCVVTAEGKQEIMRYSGKSGIKYSIPPRSSRVIEYGRSSSFAR